MQEAYLIQPSFPPYVHTSHTSFNGNGTSFQRLVNWTVSLQESVLKLVLADREVRSPLSVSCQAWQMGIAGWHHGDLELGPWSLIPSCCGLCCGKDLSAFPVLWFLLLLRQCLHLPLALSSALCVVDSLHGADRHVGVVWHSWAVSICYRIYCRRPPSACHTWLPLERPLGSFRNNYWKSSCLSASSRAVELGCRQPVVGGVPNAADLAVIDIYNLKAISQMSLHFL